jgi:GNAT superfamily N-acetyltransferase
MQTVPLDRQRHRRAEFDCGVEVLNTYLKVMANQQTNKDNTRTFVLEDQHKPGNIIGYYSLAMAQVDLGKLPKHLAKRHQSNHSAGLIARLAVDKGYSGRGYGEYLLVDALLRLVEASNNVAFPLVVVDAKAGVATFYQRMGFHPFEDLPDKLFMTIADLKRTLHLE